MICLFTPSTCDSCLVIKHHQKVAMTLQLSLESRQHLVVLDIVGFTFSKH